MDEVEGKVAVITGGASGIGAAMAERFGRAGMRLVLGDIEPAALESKGSELRDAGHEVATVVCDVSDGAQVEALRDAALEAFGSVHVVCNNAGVGGGGLISNLGTKDWEWVLGVNLWGVIHGLRVFLPLLQDQDEGHIVNTASVAGLFAAPFMGPYSASKFAVVAISETLFHELAMAGSKVGVSVLCPAWVRTRIHESARNRPEHLVDLEALGAAAEAAEVAGTAGALGGSPADGLPGGGDVASLLESVIASGMPPEDVADRVLAAVLAREFYILTHDDSKAAVRARMEAILDEADPRFFFPQ
jgi:NAD(P)-dependent dehydrogenase (short-subunit alcohol dehydrogenase family)